MILAAGSTTGNDVGGVDTSVTADWFLRDFEYEQSTYRLHFFKNWKHKKQMLYSSPLLTSESPHLASTCSNGGNLDHLGDISCPHIMGQHKKMLTMDCCLHLTARNSRNNTINEDMSVNSHTAYCVCIWTKKKKETIWRNWAAPLKMEMMLGDSS